jgi:hypothetical protein
MLREMGSADYLRISLSLSFLDSPSPFPPKPNPMAQSQRRATNQQRQPIREDPSIHRREERRKNEFKGKEWKEKAVGKKVSN